VKLHLPSGVRRLLSRRARRLAYASQREDGIAWAHRRVAQLHEHRGSPHRTDKSLLLARERKRFQAIMR